jgi:hypothetical protein
MTTEDDGVNWTVYRAELPNLPRHTSLHIDHLLARTSGARVRLPIGSEGRPFAHPPRFAVCDRFLKP